mmetsp:Transcript_102115/g.271760  ORF Transcript_102115/g.271760 Transcript_102115/m.271760 type:complete len:205 (-) Transcript_102115:556-1170(-)
MVAGPRAPPRADPRSRSGDDEGNRRRDERKEAEADGCRGALQQGTHAPHLLAGDLDEQVGGLRHAHLQGGNDLRGGGHRGVDELHRCRRRLRREALQQRLDLGDEGPGRLHHPRDLVLHHVRERGDVGLNVREEAAVVGRIGRGRSHVRRHELPELLLDIRLCRVADDVKHGSRSLHEGQVGRQELEERPCVPDNLRSRGGHLF